MIHKHILKVMALIIVFSILNAGLLNAATANRAWIELTDSGMYRVRINYTLPDLKQYRQTYVDFHSKKEANEFFSDIIRGADFFPEDPKKRRFINHPAQPMPW